MDIYYLGIQPSLPFMVYVRTILSICFISVSLFYICLSVLYLSLCFISISLFYICLSVLYLSLCFISVSLFSICSCKIYLSVFNLSVWYIYIYFCNIYLSFLSNCLVAVSLPIFVCSTCLSVFRRICFNISVYLSLCSFYFFLFLCLLKTETH